MIKTIIFLFIILTFSTFAQVKDYQIGSSRVDRQLSSTGFFDFSRPNTLNIEVNVWGFVKYPGKYLVPENSTAMDLMSYAGGPTDAANLDDLRIYRVTINSNDGVTDTTRQFIPFNYQELLWANELKKSGINIPILKAGDNLSVPGEPKIYSKDWIQISLSIVGILISLTTLLVTIAK